MVEVDQFKWRDPPMDETVETLLRRYIGGYGWGWGIACKLINNKLGTQYTVGQLKEIYNKP